MGLLDWFRKKPPSRVESRLEFVGEQDGENERQLKALLVPILAQHAHIVRAYLARAGFQPSDPTSVVLCLIGPDLAAVGFLNEIQAAFHTLAPSGVFLDIAFLTDAQEADVARVCPPFYSRAGRRSSVTDGDRVEFERPTDAPKKSTFQDEAPDGSG